MQAPPGDNLELATLGLQNCTWGCKADLTRADRASRRPRDWNASEECEADVEGEQVELIQVPKHEITTRNMKVTKEDTDRFGTHDVNRCNGCKGIVRG